MFANEAQQSTLLEEGIAAARNGNRTAAREILLRLSEIDQSSEAMWLWLSSVAVDRSEAEHFARQALDANPESQLAHQWLTRLGSAGSLTNAGHLPDEIAEGLSRRQSCPTCDSLDDATECLECGFGLTVDATEALLGEIGRKAVVIQKTLEDVQRLTEERADGSVFANAFQLGVGYLNVRQLTRVDRGTGAEEGFLTDDLNLTMQVEDLLKDINQITGFTGAASTAQADKTKVRGNYRILVVDDSATVRKLVTARLEEAGHQVHFAAHGREALNRLKEFVPDLVISDITMPHVDGYQLCKTIRNNPLTQEIPVIMLSGRDGEFDRFRGTMVGATDFITKPFEMEMLLDLIEQHCQT